MSRSGYGDYDGEEGAPPEFYYHALTRAMNGKRGQAALREFLTVLDTMPDKRLISGDLVTKDGCMCAVGVLATARGIDVSRLDPDDSWETPRYLAAKLGLAESMVREIIYENDQGNTWRGTDETPEQRWRRIRNWVARLVGEPALAGAQEASDD